MLDIISKLLLHFFPTLLLLGLAGWGALTFAVLRIGNRARVPTLFECAFAGFFICTMIGMVANFWIGLGAYAGVWMLSPGLLFYGVFFYLHREWFDQTLFIFVIAAVISWLFTGMNIGIDGGGYHIAIMNWAAYEPQPLGLAHAGERFGTNSAWLVFVSGLRVENLLGWMHVIHAEIAVRTLALAWLVWQFAQEILKGWTIRAKFYAVSTFAMAVLLKFSATQTTTDYAANVFGLLAWVLYCDFSLRSEERDKERSRIYFVLLLFLAAISVSFKVSMVPIVILPFLLLSQIKTLKEIKSLASLVLAIVLTGGYALAWLGRGFMQSGCLLYPASFTCFDVSWAAPGELVAEMSSTVRAWARHPGPDYVNYTDFWNSEWIGPWLLKYIDSTPFIFLMVSVLIGLSVVLFKAKNRGGEKTAASKGVSTGIIGGWGTLVIALGGFAFNLLTAPDPRFSWAFYGMIGITILHWALSHNPLILPNIGFLYGQKKVIFTGTALVAILLTLLLPWSYLALPTVRVVPNMSSNGWPAASPATGNSCWGLFPCATRPLEHIHVEDRGRRLVFIDTRKTPKDDH